MTRLLEKPVMIGVIFFLIFTIGFFLHQNMKLRLENSALQKELKNAQEIFLSYAKERVEALNKKNNALSILKDGSKNEIEKFNTINSYLFLSH